MNKKRAIILLIIIIILASYLRIYFLRNESLSSYEAVFLEISDINIFNPVMIDVLKPHQVHHPVFLYLIHFWVRLFNNEDSTVKSLSAVLNILLIVAIILFAFYNNELFGLNTALLTVFIIAVSPVHVFFSRLLTPYTFFALLSFISNAFFILLQKKNKLRYSLFYVSSMVILFYTHVFGMLIFLIHNAFAFFAKKNIKKWIILIVVIVLLYLPIMIAMYPAGILGLPIIVSVEWGLRGIKGYAQWDPVLPKPQTILETCLDFAAGDYFLLSLFIFLVAFGLLKNREKIKLPLFYLISFILPLLFVYLFSFLFISIYKEKALLFISIPFFILVASGIANLKKLQQALILMIILTVSFLKLFSPSFAQPLQDWRNLVSDIKKFNQPKNVLLIPSYAKSVFAHYYKGRFFAFDTIEELESFLSSHKNSNLPTFVVTCPTTLQKSMLIYIKKKYGLLTGRIFRSSKRYGLKSEIGYFLLKRKF